jgi:hypothetical protein
MQFSLSFFIHFILSFVGFMFIGIYLCRGSWRNGVRYPLELGLTFLALSHVYGSSGNFVTTATLISIGLLGGLVWRASKDRDFTPSEIRDGHNLFSLLAGAALFALTVQMHAVLFGVPVFQLVK